MILGGEVPWGNKFQNKRMKIARVRIQLAGCTFSKIEDNIFKLLLFVESTGPSPKLAISADSQSSKIEVYTKANSRQQFNSRGRKIKND